MRGFPEFEWTMICPTCNGTRKVTKEIRDICLIEVKVDCPDCAVQTVTIDPVAQGMGQTDYTVDYSFEGTFHGDQ